MNPFTFVEGTWLLAGLQLDGWPGDYNPELMSTFCKCQRCCGLSLAL